MPDKIEISKNHRFSILLVDDERANLNLLFRTFRRDYDLHMADDGDEALNILAEHKVDMIISDQRMPRMTGIEMLTRSRTILPYAVRIILTAYTDVEDIISSINEGHIYRYIVKPWDPEELRTIVSQSLDHYRLEKENRELVNQLQQSLNDLQTAQQELVHRERLSTLGRVASTVIHDLKLPMSNIRTSAALLAKPDLDEISRKEFSAIIMKEVDRLIEMTREILEFSRGESKLEKVQFNFSQMLDDICQQIERDFDGVGVKITKNWEDVGTYLGDEGRLRRVFLNLAVNARDAMPKGGKLSFGVNSNDERLRILVSDTGSGFPLMLIDRIFEPFITHGKHDGTGLGLAIARRIIDGHGGSIAARNRLEKGAEIEILLPRYK